MAERLNCLAVSARGRAHEAQEFCRTRCSDGRFFYLPEISTMKDVAAHFARVPITTFAVTPNAPPLDFKVSVNGEKAAVRAPNFLVLLSKSSSASGDERWSISPEFDI
jgi:hypothetical protein